MKKEPSALLILACSQRKRPTSFPAPALHVYDGVNYRVVRRTLLANGWPPGLRIRILSAKYGLIDATTLIEPYDQRLTEERARKLNRRVLAELKKIPEPGSVFINMGEDYAHAIAGIETVYPRSKITYAPGPIGLKMRAMKKWLEQLKYGTARTRRSRSDARPYLYFFPDWDDFIYEPFSANEETSVSRRRVYAHEACGTKIPFDGLLLSLAHMHLGKGPLHRFANAHEGRISVRRRLRIPDNLLLFGDCGAFSYASESAPPISTVDAAKLYHKFGFDIGASVDHIPLAEVLVRDKNGATRRRRLSDNERRSRMLLTRDNAERFLKECKSHSYCFSPMGVVQGISVRTYVARLNEYMDMGYEHLAIGGLVPRSDDEILKIACAVRAALQARTRTRSKGPWIHLFGILRPKLQPMFRELGVSSFDSASYFRKAWLRSDQNYIAPDGTAWFGTIRVPISTSKGMLAAARANGLSQEELARMEEECLEALDACDKTSSASDRVTKAIDRYGPLLERKAERNHFSKKHAALLAQRPWQQCSCPFCRSAGIHVVVFRGASRNKRRGLHNTWVFYHKVMNGKEVAHDKQGDDD